MIRSGVVPALVSLLALPAPAGAQASAVPPAPFGQEQAGAPPAPEPAPPPAGEATRPRSTPTPETFDQWLSPYGAWVDTPDHGRVWQPRVVGGWRPYTHGHWEWSANDWLWVSDEPWGWATDHYGRWSWDSALGWYWIPGYDWAPAWVTWRYGAGMVGWAPLFPGYSIYATTYPSFAFAWTFVPVSVFVGFPVFRFAFFDPFFVRRCFFFTRPAPARFFTHGFPTPRWGGPPRALVTPRPAGLRGAPAPAPRMGGGLRSGSFAPAPRMSGGLRSGSFAPAPRMSGGLRGGSFAPAPRMSGGFRGGSFAPAPRMSGGFRGGSFAPAPRMSGGFAPAPRMGGGFRGSGMSHGWRR